MYLSRKMLHEAMKIARRWRHLERVQQRRDGFIFEVVAGWQIAESVSWIGLYFRRARDNLGQGLSIHKLSRGP